MTTGADPVDAVAAIVVAYFPEREPLAALLAALAGQVGHAIVVDNTPGVGATRSLTAALEVGPPLEVIEVGANLGLAAGQNRGIAAARARGYRYLLLLDQDSVPEPGMVQALLDALAGLRARGVRVGAVGPCWTDPVDGGVNRFFSVRAGKARSADCAGSPAAELKCDYLIASGCLIPAAVLDVVGPMDEALFIDQIDIEWGLRAGSHGFALFGICRARMRHRIGIGARTSWFFGSQTLPLNARARDYYVARNVATLALRRRRVPLGWRLVHLKVLANLLLATLRTPDERGARLRLLALGLLDAIRGRLGRNPSLS